MTAIAIGWQGDGVNPGGIALFAERRGVLVRLGKAIDVGMPLCAVPCAPDSVLFVSDGQGQGSLLSAEWNPSGDLELVTRVASPGKLPCSLALSPAAKHIVAAHYGSGTVSVHAVLSDGSIAERGTIWALPEPESGSCSERQTSAHPHQVIFGFLDETLAVVDLGLDKILFADMNEVSGALTHRASFALESGAGPRNLVIGAHSSVAFLACELDSSIVELRSENGLTNGLTATGAFPLGRSATTRNYPSDIDRSGNHVFIANRGASTIAVLDSNGDRSVREFDCGGLWPLSIKVVGDHLLVANRDSNSIVEMRIDRANGRLSEPKVLLSLPAPTCVAMT
jgi:6-phosphogluconolactonase (cycloisomerase 2 family)